MMWDEPAPPRRPLRQETVREHLANALQIHRATNDAIAAGTPYTIADIIQCLDRVGARCAAAREELDRGNL